MTAKRLSTIEKILLLQDLKFLHYLSGDHLAFLAGMTIERDCSQGEVLFNQGSEQTQVFFLTRGTVRIGDGREGQKVEKSVLDFWACMAKLPHSATASCATRCTLLMVSHEDFFDALSSEPELAAAILRELAENHVNPDFSQPEIG